MYEIFGWIVHKLGNEWISLLHAFSRKTVKSSAMFLHMCEIKCKHLEGITERKQVFREIFSLSNSQAREKLSGMKKKVSVQKIFLSGIVNQGYA